MAGRNDFLIRPPAVAGRFYPGDPQACRNAALELLRPGGGKGLSAPIPGQRGWGGIVPHAGWICSGAIAGQTIAELARLNRDSPPRVVVVFGAIHTPLVIEQAALDSRRIWRMPSGDVRPAEGLAERLGAGASSLFVRDERFHQQEHAIEVELPLIQAAWPDAELLPIEVPLIDTAVQIGRETAQRVLSTWRNCVFLASSDLTHYGPAYRFAPAGVGLEGLAWAKQNDSRILRLITDYSPGRIVPEVRERANACGGGAIAAMLAACQEAGATRATLLRHASSYETLAGKVPDDPSNAVGYAGVVVS
jgi:AmmeMemoRadiSam system protein B